MQLILVCGPWSSGTTAVAGMLERLGARGLPPYFGTNDPRTPNSFESQPFRQLVQALADEDTLSLRVERAVARERLAEFRDAVEKTQADNGTPFFLKYPLSALLIHEICAAIPTRLVYVLRPFGEIEATRQRRGWPAQFGGAGAGVLYPCLFEALVEHKYPTLVLRYAELLDEPDAKAAQLAQFCGLPADAGRIAEAAAVVRKRAAP